MTGPEGRPATNERLLQAIEKIDDRLRTFQDQISIRFDGLDNRFMPKGELIVRLDEGRGDRSEIRQRISLAEAKHEADIKAVYATIERGEERRKTERHVALGTIFTTIGLLISIMWLVLAHI